MTWLKRELVFTAVKESIFQHQGKVHFIQVVFNLSSVDTLATKLIFRKLCLNLDFLTHFKGLSWDRIFVYVLWAQNQHPTNIHFSWIAFNISIQKHDAIHQIPDLAFNTLYALVKTILFVPWWLSTCNHHIYLYREQIITWPTTYFSQSH